LKEKRRRKRLEFDSKLISLFNEWAGDGKDHSKQVYYQPPNKTQLTYPCIIYNRGNTNTVFADDSKYKEHDRWTVLVIGRDGDSGLVDYVLTLPYSTEEPTYKVDNLYHCPITIYY
jgi:di/tripeptidase